VSAKPLTPQDEAIVRTAWATVGEGSWPVPGLLATIDSLRAENETLRAAARSLESALTGTGDHHMLPGGYCLDCQGGCMLGFAEDNAEAIRNAAYAGPSPFEVKP